MLAIASGKSANSDFMSFAGFIQASGELRGRSSLAMYELLAMHSIASCASWKLSSAKQLGLVPTSGKLRA